MNKSDLVDKVAEDAELTKADANDAITSVVEGIQESLSRGEKVTLVGFGTFSVRERSARKGRNPQTGETIQIPAKKVAKFKPGKHLREAVE